MTTLEKKISFLEQELSAIKRGLVLPFRKNQDDIFYKAYGPVLRTIRSRIFSELYGKNRKKS